MDRPSKTSILSRGAPWLAVVTLALLTLLAYQWMSTTETKRERVRLNSPLPPTRVGLKQATLIPGRVVELHTNKGEIHFVLFDKDCPKTCARVAGLVSNGSYSKVRFGRVEKEGLIQIEAPAAQVSPLSQEIREGLINTKGAVGMARTNDPNSATSVFYILLEPWQHLDYEYTVFGRVIRGMDVVARIKKNDLIQTAVVRPIDAEDRKLFDKALQIESQRRTQ